MSFVGSGKESNLCEAREVGPRHAKFNWELSAEV